jgi:hypothetical protein
MDMRLKKHVETARATAEIGVVALLCTAGFFIEFFSHWGRVFAAAILIYHLSTFAFLDRNVGLKNLWWVPFLTYGHGYPTLRAAGAVCGAFWGMMWVAEPEGEPIDWILQWASERIGEDEDEES